MAGIKRIIAVLLLAICVSCCAFADTNGPQLPESYTFSLHHDLNASSETYFYEFRNPANGSLMKDGVVLGDSVAPVVFATLVINFSLRSTPVSRLSVNFTDLVNTVEGDNSCFPYTIRILNPDSADDFVSVVPNGENGAGSALLYESRNFIKSDISVHWNMNEIVDFEITLDDSDVAPGTYVGSIVLVTSAE